ncbi:hypothetical protein PHAVU_005G097400, partial [Phaseolus vulgaris]|uniref:Uncharacterized protein n=1 Tax=Phaseolus vulgaris TaxID=3885 RepID=V7BUT5_PHAVU|nr:hypothetical protein PHAVU_005G097400g [Phaseolus vulgaris]ESW21762.1 hypothetical protein PHAVU_005G097400g [Phaseolus vulgaris]
MHICYISGNGLQEFCNAVQDRLKDSMVWVEALVPFENGNLLSTIHQVGMIEKIEHVPLRFASMLTPMR